MMLNIMRDLTRHVRRLSAQNARLATHNIDARVAAQLLLYAEQHGVAVDEGILISVPLKQQTLASAVGASREKVNAILSQYQNSGCIALRNKHRILILDIAALQQIYDERK